MASKFAIAMKAKANAWKKARKAEPRKGSNFGPADVPDGQYEAIISASCGITEPKGQGKVATPYVEITATICDGEHEGKEPRNYYYLDGKMPSDSPDAMPTNEERLAGDLKQLLPNIDVDNLDEAQIEACVEQINADHPKCKIGVRNRIGKKGTKGEGKRYQDTFFNELLEGATNHGNEESSQEETSGEEEAEEGGEEEGGEEEGGEPDTADESVAPAVGDEVNFKPKGAKVTRKFIVKTVNQGKQTVTLSDGKKKFSEVAWSDLQ